MQCPQCKANCQSGAQACVSCGATLPAAAGKVQAKKTVKRPNRFSGGALDEMRMRSLYNSFLAGASIVLKDREDESKH